MLAVARLIIHQYNVVFFPFFSGQSANLRLALVQIGVIPATSNISISFGALFTLQSSKVLSVMVRNNCSYNAFLINACQFSPAAFSFQIQKVSGLFSATISLQDKTDYFSAVILITFSSVQNPLVGGWAELLPIGGTKIVSPSNIVIFNASASTLAAVDPRRANLATFNILDIRGLSATSSLTNLSLQISPNRNISFNGSIEIQIPAGLAPVSGGALRSVPSDSSYYAIGSLDAKILLSNASILIVSIQYSKTARKVPLLLTAGVSVSLLLGPFQTPNAQPPVELGPLRLRTVNFGSSSDYIASWDQPDSWGSLTDTGRVMEESVECCTTIELTAMGPISALANLTIQTPLAGAISNIMFEFVTSLQIPARSFFLILMPFMFQTCSAGSCNPGACTVESCSAACIDQKLKIYDISVYDQNDNLNASAAPSKVWKCGSSSVNVLGSFCSAPLVDCSSSSAYVGSNAIAFSSQINILAGFRVAVYAGGITLPQTPGNVSAFSISLQLQGNISQTLTPWTEAIIYPDANIYAAEAPPQNSFITPQDTTVGVTTSYSIFLLSSTGLPVNGWLEITFPSGTQFGSLNLVGAAFSGKIAGTGTPLANTLYLQTPASTSANTYGNQQIFLLPNQCTISVIDASSSVNFPKQIVWPIQYSDWTSWYFSSLCYKISQAVSAFVVSAYEATLPPQKITITSTLTIDTSRFSSFAISNLNTRTPVTYLGSNTIRIGTQNCGRACFDFPFPAQGILNLTVSGIVNGPIPKIATGPYKIQLFTSQGELLETADEVAGSVLSVRNVTAEILLDSAAAHGRTGCTVIISVDSQINAGSTIEIKFSDLSSQNTDPRTVFSEAGSLYQVYSVNSSASLQDILSRSLLLNVQSKGRLVQVNATLLSVSSTDCFWNQSDINHATLLQTCMAISISTAKVLIETFVPAGSIVGLRILGKLRNPARPGEYSWPLDAVKVFQWTSSVPSNKKTLTADANEEYSPALLTLQSNGLINTRINITSGIISLPSVQVSNPYVSQSTNIRFSFFTESGIMATDSIFIVVPSIFSVNISSTDQPFSVIGAVEGLPGNLAVIAVTQLNSSRSSCLIQLARTVAQEGSCSDSLDGAEIDISVGFLLGPFIGRDVADQNFQGEQEPGYSFAIFVVDANNLIVEGSESGMKILPTSWGSFSGSFPTPSLLPAVFNLAVNFSSSRSAALVNFSMFFTTSGQMFNGSEFFLFVPSGFSTHGTVTCSLYQYISNSSYPIRLSISPVQKEPIYFGRYFNSFVLRASSNTVINANSNLNLRCSNLLNPTGGAGKSLLSFSLATSRGCSKISAVSCFWLMNIGSTQGLMTQPGVLGGGIIKFTSTTAGNEVMAEFSFSTANPFPALGSVEIKLPTGYVALPDLSYCSDLRTLNRTCPLPCLLPQNRYCPVGLVINGSSFTISPNGSSVFIRSWNPNDLHSISLVSTYPNFTFLLDPSVYPDNLHTPGFSGINLAFNITAIKLRQTPGPSGYFQLRIFDSNGNLIDESDGPGIQPISGPILPGRLLMTLVQPLSFAAKESTTAIVQFTTTNPVPPLGMICVEFPTGFDVSDCMVSPYNTEMISIYGIDAQRVCVMNSAGIPAKSFYRMYISNVINAAQPGPTKVFQMYTADARQNTIDFDANVLFQVLVPALLSNSLMQLLNPVASADSDISVTFSPIIDSYAGDSILLSIPPGFKTRSEIPLKQIKANNITICSQEARICPNATTRALPYPSISVDGIFPASSFSDQDQVVTIFGSGFDTPGTLEVEFGSTLVRPRVVSSTVIEIDLFCAATELNRPIFCDFQDPYASIVKQICRIDYNSQPITSFTLASCSSSICNNVSNASSFCLNIPVSMSAAISVSFDETLRASSEMNFSLYRRCSDSCPNNCWETERRGICKGNQCECKYPFDGIDCMLGPMPLTVSPNFGPASGTSDIFFFFF